jgi:hypothetical protein
MMKILSIVCCIVLFSFFAKAQAPIIQWQRSIGSTQNDWFGEEMRETSDGGYVLFTNTSATDGDASSNHDADPDVWVIKLDGNGGLQWTRCIGGDGYDYGTLVAPASDGGWAMTGRTASNNTGDITGFHGIADTWVIKFAPTGNFQWVKSYGGSLFEEGLSIRATNDGGHIVAGRAFSPNDGDLSGHHGDSDGWLFKISATGVLEWQRCVGGSGSDDLDIAEQTHDGGYIAVGSAGSADGDVIRGIDTGGTWVVRMDSVRNIIWQRHIGSVGSHQHYYLKQTSDEGYLLAYNSSVLGGGGCIAKLDSVGNVTAEKCYGQGTRFDYSALLFKETLDSGVIMALTDSLVKFDAYGNFEWERRKLPLPFADKQSVRLTDILDNGGFTVAGYDSSVASGDAWVARLDDHWDIKWEKLMGGSNRDGASMMQRTADDGYMMVGYSYSNDGDVTGHHGNNTTSDIWVVKLSPDLSANCFAYFSIYPDSTHPGVYYGFNQSQGSSLSYLWHFGDGDSSTLRYPSHTYSTPGQYYVCLTIDDGAGCVNTYCDSSYLVFKMEGGLMSQLNILDPDAPSAIGKVSKDFSLSVYPNPASDRLFIETNDEIPHRVYIYSTLGLLVKLTILLPGRSIDISALTTGAYIAEVKRGNTLHRVRWLKM